VCYELLCAAVSVKIAIHLYLLVYYIIIKLQLLVLLLSSFGTAVVRL
jgi:hypothetical protein